MRRLTRRSRRRQAGGGGTPNHERWLITYADLITLLLIFFVIMYAMSKVDINKYTSLANALKLEFSSADSLMPQGSGLLQSPSNVNGNKSKPKPDSNPKDNAGAQEENQEQELQDLLKMIQTYISDNKLQDAVSVVNRPEGVAITFKDVFLFDLGKADLKKPAYPVLSTMSKLLDNLDAKISIEGHTDDLAVQYSSIYRDNWGLSAARALSVLRYFTDTAKLDPRSFIMTGYADTMPVVPNDTETNRQKNRRVEIVVLRDQ